MKNPFSLEGKHIVVSGASSGIGRQCAISCAAMGAKVSLIARNEERLKETFSSLFGDGHQIYSADLTNEEEIKHTVTQIVSNGGRIDGLLNVAGISATLLLKSASESRITDLFRSNVLSAFMLTREVCRMGNFSKEGGSIVFYSSVMGSFGDIGKSVYGMTKGALVAAAKSLACEMAPKNIRVNAISPGLIVTPINENQPHITDPKKREVLENKHLLGLGSTEDVANASVYLLSDAARWVTGINLFVDGGFSVK